jgi:hypothetical protein
MRLFPYLLLVLSMVLMLALTGSTQGEDVTAPWSIEPWVNEQAPVVQSQNQTFSLSGLERTDLSGVEPPHLCGSNGSSASNYSDLWITNNGSFDRCSLAHQGGILDLIVYVPLGGRSDLYAISVSRGIILHNGKEVSPGYYKANLQVGGAGRILVIYLVDSQPSNALIIDVLPGEEQPHGTVDIGGLHQGSAKVTIISDRLKGYDVYVDEAFYSSDGADGMIDGKAKFVISGDRLHTIVISTRGSRNNELHRTEYVNTFKSGYAYTLRI